MNWLQSILYGLIAGLTEFMPISSEAHQLLMKKLYGITSALPTHTLFLHVALLLAVLTACRTYISHLSRDQKKANRLRRSRKPSQQIKGQYDVRLLRTACLVQVICLVLSMGAVEGSFGLPVLCLFLMLNGIILYFPEHMRHGNKDARHMTGFDGLLIGLFAALSVFPGISRIGTVASVSIARGAKKEDSLNWALLISVPALIVLIAFDVLRLLSGAAPFILSNLAASLLTAVFAYIGAYLSIVLMRFLTVRIGFSGFAYYSWGAALFTFVLYLI